MTDLRVVLIDDHKLFREGLKALLRSRGILVIGEGGNGKEGHELARQLQPDVVIIDLAMPTMGGLEATRLIKAEMPHLPIVVLTASDEDDDLFEAVKAGAQGYLLKSLDGDTFIDLIQAAARGEPALTAPLAAKILAEFARTAQMSPGEATPARVGGEASDRVGLLTTREQEVLELLVDGHSNREIAARLFVSENTVKYHLRNILGKLHLQNRAQVVAYALREGIAKPD